MLKQQNAFIAAACQQGGRGADDDDEDDLHTSRLSFQQAATFTKEQQARQQIAEVPPSWLPSRLWGMSVLTPPRQALEREESREESRKESGGRSRARGSAFEAQQLANAFGTGGVGAARSGGYNRDSTPAGTPGKMSGGASYSTPSSLSAARGGGSGNNVNNHKVGGGRGG